MPTLGADLLHVEFKCFCVVAVGDRKLFQFSETLRVFWIICKRCPENNITDSFYSKLAVDIVHYHIMFEAGPPQVQGAAHQATMRIGKELFKAAPFFLCTVSWTPAFAGVAARAWSLTPPAHNPCA